jgi:hypothetical protein
MSIKYDCFAFDAKAWKCTALTKFECRKCECKFYKPKDQHLKH